MPPRYEAPGTYIEEGHSGPRAIQEAATALPIFIGYTSHATRDEEGDLLLKPQLIGSLAEYDQCFGPAHPEAIEVTITTGADGQYLLSAITTAAGDATSTVTPAYLLRHSLEMFFANGGSGCYVVSVGYYHNPPTVALRGDGSVAPISARHGLLDGLEAAGGERGPTLVVIPEAVKLADQEYAVLVQAMLAQCKQLGDRFAILDLYHGAAAIDPAEVATSHPRLTADRALFGANNLMYGACYYPFLRTTLTPPIAGDESNVVVTFPGGSAPLGSLRESQQPLHALVEGAIRQAYLVLPPSGAIAGLYAVTDRERGVWQAPANVGLTRVVEPTVAISSSFQEALNVDASTGKSINAIREFPGRGTLVWGARTLAGNDHEWRYLSVRRFMTTVEVSVRESIRWAVFEPNEHTTWTGLSASIENYLDSLWRGRALAGTSRQEAFFVRCGAGSTMSTQDILEGRIIIEMGLAPVRPAEFMLIRIVLQAEGGQTAPPRPGTSEPALAAPPPAFALVVEQEQVGFAEASGLQAEDAVDYRALPALSRLRRRLPGIAKSGTVTLKRGIAAGDGSFLRWMRTAGGRSETRNIEITMLDDNRRAVGTWTIRNARPTKFVGPGLNASGNDVEIESVDLAHDGVERKDG